ncbi:glutamine--fructose-6-phosphate transaminase (isomerizing), partial [bacterium]|nr:glutamine--fructose-6-phosphate transaminase (isomerizing) [bacterium]
SRDVYYLENKEIAVLTKESIDVYDKNLKHKEISMTSIKWDSDSATKEGYKHFMIKEIFEQPKVVEKTINTHIKNNKVDIELNFNINQINKIYIVACGTAYHAGLNAKYLFESLVKISTEVDIASEFRYRNPILDEKTLVVIISQSGETADTLAALRLAKSKKCQIVSIVNVVGSSIAREADNVIYTWAGPEIAVASTKAYTTQLAILYLLSIKFAKENKKITEKEYLNLLNEIKNIPNKIEKSLKLEKKIKDLAKKFYKNKDVYFIGRGIDYCNSMEGSLKLKEVSYIHAESYAAGELKHGAIALIEKNTLVIASATYNDLLLKTISNIKEVKSRGAITLIISNEKIEGDYNLIVESTYEYFKSIINIIPLQLLAYYISYYKKCDIDKPKNLAKSVTVE